MGPYRIIERIKFDKIIENIEIKKHPLFILGFWRSGTTFLQNILSLDKNFGYLTTFQAYLPGVFLSGEKRWKKIVATSIPDKRPMDDIAMHVDFPQEDQYAVGAFSPYSYYHGWCFPKKMEYYNKYVIMDNVSQKDIQKWKDIYLYILKKVSYYVKGKRLILKNQDNTAKVKLLLEMFPNAKFLLITRNPYSLYYSMMKFMRIVIPLYCVQKPPDIKIVEESMMNLYERMFKKYLKEHNLIPKDNLLEVKYEDLISQPYITIKKIYKNLNLTGFKKAENKFKNYFQIQRAIQIGRYEISNDVKNKIDEKWGFSFKEFGY
jgi:hypothetical protein